MNLIEFLREKLTTSITEKVSNFLGEPQQNVETAMQAALPTILGGLVQQGTTDEGAKKIMDIIKDGGHTGDIFDNMPSLLSNYDKSQLLVTIGSNIFNHFFGNTSSVLVEKVASLSSIKKTSSASLLGLTSPLVLGAIGYAVQTENLGINGLKKLLNEQRDDVSKALPQIIAPHLPLRSISPVQPEEPIVAPPVIEKKVETKTSESKKTEKKSIISNLLPWIFLIVLALLSAYYLRTCKADTEDEISSSAILESDSLMTDEKPGIINDSDDIVKDNVVSDTPAKKPTSSNQPSVNKTERRTSTASSNSAGGSQINSQKLRSSRSWIGLSSNSFKSNSAEIRNRGEINSIASYLQQNPNATISIAPAGSGRVAEDRAYAIREQLFQKGVDVSRIIIEPARGSGSGVSIKLNR